MTTGPLQAFRELVAMKYQLYNGLFLGLPFEDIEDTGVQLPLFAKACAEKLAAGKSPYDIVQEYFKELPRKMNFENQLKRLFKFLQLVERQVVLFDALEDAAFEELNAMDGPGTLTHLLGRTQDNQGRENLAKELAHYRTRIVLTAHPTQFYPGSILSILTDLSEAIQGNHLNDIRNLLLQTGKTRFQNRAKPTPLDEAKSLLWYLENVFYPTLPNLQARLAAAVAIKADNQQPTASLDPCIELGFWPGGDRDGNPFVTTEITLQVGQLLRQSLFALYLKDIEALQRRLTFDGISEKLVVIAARLKETQAPQIEEKAIRNLRNAGSEKTTRLGKAMPYITAEQLLKDLQGLREDLSKNHQGLFTEWLDLFISKVQVFGFHFASIDLRQDSRIHAQTLAQIFQYLDFKKGIPEELAIELRRYGNLSEENRLLALEKWLALPNPQFAVQHKHLDALLEDTLASFTAVKAIQKSNGERGLNRYVISQSHSAANILEVMALASFASMKVNRLDLDIVPLFETIEDLKNAELIMETLYRHKFYLKHLSRRGSKQTIMLGFSDGTKDGGYITANWAIYKAKQRLTQISRAHGVQVIFFDGRGGPPSRGGGNTHKFYRSLGKSIEHNEIQLTVQGQTITSSYGTPQAARYNVEQLFTSGLECTLFPEEAEELTPENVQLLDQLSAISADAYTKFKQHELFIPYLEEITPLGYYNLLNIASRPTRRKQSEALRFEDLRAIPFVGAWSQMKQNIPGFYGFGIALAKLIAQGRKTELKDLYKNSLFFHTLVENAMMSLSKSNFALTQYLAKDKRFGKFWKLIYSEATQAKDLLKEITGQHKLLETALPVRESIYIREKLILPLLVIQQYAMNRVKQLRVKPEESSQEALEIYTKMVVKAMAANINASRNSA